MLIPHTYLIKNLYFTRRQIMFGIVTKKTKMQIQLLVDKKNLIAFF